jgi:protein-disulfide isomerase
MMRRWRFLLPTIGVVLIGLDVSRLTGWWPCDIACQGGAHYQQMAGISVIWPALLVHVLLTALTFRDARRGGWCPWTVRLVWLTAGISAFFAAIALHLGLTCPYCLAVHGGSLLLLVLTVPFSPSVRWWHAVSWLIAGVLGANAVFHHAPVADAVTGVAQGPETPVASAAADRGRTYGDATSHRTLEVVIDLTCRHCAEQYRPLMEALKPAIAAKRVRVIVRHLVRPSQAASGPAAELALAAAALQEHAAALEILLPSNPDAGFAGLKARLEEVIDPVKLDGVLTKDRAAITALLNDDQQRISQLGVGPRTPSAVLIEDGKVNKTWSGDLPVPAIVAALDGAL